jgi:hypothetical protein
MKRKTSMKKLWRMIVNILLLLSLTACEDGCVPKQALLVAVRNRSAIAVKVTVSGNVSEETYEVISPGDSRTFEISDVVYSARVQPMDDWLEVAQAKRSQLQAILYKLNKPPSPDDPDYQPKVIAPGVTSWTSDPEAIEKVMAELHDLQSKITAYQSQSQVKTCQGFVTLDVAGVVNIRDGEVPRTIGIACVSPEKKE